MRKSFYLLLGLLLGVNLFTKAQCTGISALPWTEHFDTVLIPDLPACWLVENGEWETTDNSNSTYDADALSGVQFLRASYDAIDEFVWTPGFQLTAGQSYDFSFEWAGDGYDEWTGDVFCNDTQSSAGATQLGASFVTFTTVTTLEYKEETRRFTPSISGVYYFAIRVNASGVPYNLSFDDFKVETTPTCPKPTDLAVVAITVSSAQIFWTTGGASKWNIEYGPYGFTHGTGTIIHNVTTNPYTLSGLNHSTNYQFYVQDSCTALDVSFWAGPKAFSTLCNVITTLPWAEGFESLGDPDLPPCWNTESNTWITTTNSNTDEDANARHGAQFLREEYDADKEFVWTPGFQMTAGTSYDFSFWWAGDGYDTWQGDVYYNTLQDSTGATQLGNSFVLPATVTDFEYREVSNSFVPGTTGTYYFAIRVDAPNDPYYLSFDDFRMELTPNCIRPTAFSASDLGADSVVLNWVTGGANKWNIEYGTSGFALGTGTIIHNITNHPYTLHGLNPSTSYEVYVQDSCGVGDVSAWRGPLFISTSCTENSSLPFSESFDGSYYPPTCWTIEQNSGTGNWNRSTGGMLPTCTPHSGAGMSYFHSYSWVTGVSSSLITPALDLPVEGCYAKFWMYRDDAYESNLDSVNVYYNTTNSITGATFLGRIYRNITLPPSETTTGWHEYQFDLPAGSAGIGRYVIFQAVSGYGNNMYLDDVRIDRPPFTDIATLQEDITTCDTLGLFNPPIHITNTGNTVIPSGQSIEISYKVNTSANVVDTVTTPAILNPGEELTLYFTMPYLFNQFITYNCMLTANLAGDSIHTNDTALFNLILKQAPVVDLGSDTTLCGNASIVLNAGNPGATFSWWNGSNSSIHPVDSTYAGGLGTVYFWVKVTASNGCATNDTIYVTWTACTGISEANDKRLTIMPNPTSGMFTVDFGGIAGNTDILIVDITGKVIISESLDLTGTERKIYDLSSFGRGIYTLRLVNNKQVAVSKIVVN